MLNLKSDTGGYVAFDAVIIFGIFKELKMNICLPSYF